MYYLARLITIFRGIFLIEPLFKRVIYTFGALAVYRLGRQIPLPGINLDALIVLRDSFSTGGFFANFNMISGGTLSSCSIFTLGISPYISASIIMQVLTFSFPSLEALSKEGEAGRAVISRYTRYLTLLTAFMQGSMIITFMEGGLGTGINVVLSPGMWFKVKSMFLLIVGAMFIMWIGEQISRFGIGRGSGVLMFAGIVATLPKVCMQLIYAFMEGDLSVVVPVGILVLVLLLTLCIVFLERAERRIVVYYTKRSTGRNTNRALAGGAASYIPFKINSAGVMPVILTGSTMGIFSGLLSFLSTHFPSLLFLESAFRINSWSYNLLMVILIMLFNFSYLAMIVNPVEIANNIKKSGGFLPTIRPGQSTADYFDYILTRIGVPGALYIAFLAIFPGVIAKIFSLPYVFSGLSLLIAVGVALEVSAQIESYFIEDRYEGFSFSSRRS